MSKGNLKITLSANQVRSRRVDAITIDSFEFSGLLEWKSERALELNDEGLEMAYDFVKFLMDNRIKVVGLVDDSYIMANTRSLLQEISERL